MPLHSGGQLLAALQEAEQRNLADIQFAEQTRRDVRETLATDWNLYRAAAEALPRFEAAVRAAESAVAGVKRQEMAGIRTLREVLDVTNDLLTARTSAAETRAELFIRKIAVLRDAGLLSPELFNVDSSPRGAVPAADSAEQPFIPAGLPLRPLLDPIDRILSNGRVPQVPVQIENEGTYLWEDGTEALEKPSP
jgi:hypothetical protein